MCYYDRFDCINDISIERIEKLDAPLLVSIITIFMY